LTASTLPPILTPLGVINHQFHFVVHGYTGQRVVAQASTNLVNWMPISTNTLTAGTVEILDGPVTGQSQRFYRVMLTP
jgi:hypothetical protein